MFPIMMMFRVERAGRNSAQNRHVEPGWRRGFHAQVSDQAEDQIERGIDRNGGLGGVRRPNDGDQQGTETQHFEGMQHKQRQRAGILVVLMCPVEDRSMVTSSSNGNKSASGRNRMILARHRNRPATATSEFSMTQISANEISWRLTGSGEGEFDLSRYRNTNTSPSTSAAANIATLPITDHKAACSSGIVYSSRKVSSNALTLAPKEKRWPFAGGQRFDCQPSSAAYRPCFAACG